MNIRNLALSSLLAASAVACGGAPDAPQELKSARDAYAAASTGAGQQHTPAAVIEAKTALEKAESAFKEKGPDARETRDLSYIATRKAQYAEALGRTTKLEKDIAAAASNHEAARDRELASTKEKLAQSEAARAQAERDKADAEKRQAQAMADLKAIKDAAVKNESRGMVITLSGGVLFKTGESKLTTAALIDLNKVADALTSTAPDQPIVVEGHTDNQGTEGKNLTLSQARADSVVEYLITRGVAKDRITAKGIGQERPIADNKSTEGRAQNRRVEIIVGNPSR